MKRRNLKIQMNHILDGLLCISEKRHLAKLEQQLDHNRTIGIHSIKTADNYRNTINHFGNWLRNNKTELWLSKDLSLITSDICYEYLSMKEAEGKSAWTISSDMASLNKILNLKLTKENGNLKTRRQKDIIRSRTNKNILLPQKILVQNADQIIIARATGARRESLDINSKIKSKHLITKKAFIFNHTTGLPECVTLTEKGSKQRWSPIIKSLQSNVQLILKKYENDEEPLFKSYSRLIDNHFYRREYAKSRFFEELKNMPTSTNKTYKSYNIEKLREVSKNLGHERYQVTADSYLC